MGIEKKTLGAAIKQVRQARGLTQAQLAESAGLSRGGKSIALRSFNSHHHLGEADPYTPSRHGRRPLRCPTRL